MFEPEGWMYRIGLEAVPAAVSPCHRFDLDGSGKIKKNHWHVTLALAGHKSAQQVMDLMHDCCGKYVNAIPKPIVSLPGAVRYLCHQDAKDGDGRFVYSPNEIVTFGGFDVDKYVNATGDEAQRILQRVQQVAREYNLYEWADLTDYLLQVDPWLQKQLFLPNIQAYVQKYLSSLRNKSKVRDFSHLPVYSQKKCLWVSGDPGMGKTSYAREYATRNGFDYFITGSSNDPFEGYKGQPVVIWDDFRLDVKSGELADFLKATDPYNPAPLFRSRYNNVDLSHVHTIIVTTVQRPWDVGAEMEDKSRGRGEDARQLYRRFPLWIKIGEDCIIPFRYNELEGDYEVSESEKVPNTITSRARAGKVGQVASVAPPVPRFSPLDIA
jgi:hypothetical protein